MRTSPWLALVPMALAACGPTSPGTTGDDVVDTDAAAGDPDAASGLPDAPFDDTDASCGAQTENIAVENLGDPPDLLIVLDRSGSMTGPIPSFPPNFMPKWTIMRDALNSVVMQRQNNIRFGLSEFPTNDDCAADPATAVRVPIDLGQAPEVAQYFMTRSPNGNTPAAAGLAAALAHYNAIPANPAGRYVLFATDGEPNCDVDEAAAATHTVQAVQALAAAGIKTYVLGFGGAFTTGTVLNDAALAGGVPRAGRPPHYYPANSANELNAALQAISGGIIVPSCSCALATAPPVPDDVTVTLNGMIVPRSTMHTNGWDYHPDAMTITFFGSYCQQIMTGATGLTVAHPSCPSTPIELHTYAPDQAIGIAGMLSHAHQRHELHHACVLVRNFSAAIPLEMELLRAGIPFFVDGREPLTRVPEVTAQIAILKSVADVPLTDSELQSLLRYPTLYLTGTIQATLTQHVAKRCGQMRLHEALRDALRAMSGVDTRQSEAIRQRADILATMATDFGSTAHPRAVLQRYAQRTQLDQTIAKATASVTKANELSATKAAFEQYAGRHATVTALLQEWEMTAGESDQRPLVDHIRITSIHRSKGDEYPWTIVAGMDHAIIPGADPIDLEEERRLMYVAMTRAKHRLTLLAPISKNWERAMALERLIKRGHRVLIESHKWVGTQSRFIDEADLDAYWICVLLTELLLKGLSLDKKESPFFSLSLSGST